MIPEIGHFALILCLALSIVQGVLPLVGAAKGNRALMEVARPAAAANAFFGTVAIGCLAYSFYLSDFTVLNVANNSNSLLPWYYKVAATWGSHEGSILFWTVTLGWWGAAVAFCARRLPAEMVARVTGVLGLVGMGFLLFMLLTSNPFLRLFPAPAEGADLNPLLQDPGMVFHPPLLYLGYVGFAVPFAFAIAALISGRLDAAWARWMRPWTTAAWVLLTLGIALGSYWAYYELGWGGWWFWDPVENSSFMPWLTGTALIHSLAVTEKRGCFRIWTVLLAILTFSLSLLGTFLVRSGVLTFGDFTTKSGRKTPYFVNTGNYKTGAQAAKLGDYYAACIQEHMPDGITCLFGPAYKGIPLAVSAAASLYRNYDRDLPYCFNRKEAKDHGEGGSMVGYKPQDGDDVAIVEDVVTAGTAVRESIELFKHVADVNIKALFVSVDRMERGTRECSTLDELRQDYGIQVFPIVTVREVIAFLHNNSIDGKVYIDDEMKAKMEAYLEEYGAKG